MLKPYNGEMLYGKLIRAIRRKARVRPIDEAILAHDFLQAIRLCDEGIKVGGEEATAYLRMKVHLLLRVGDWGGVRNLCRELLAQADLPWARMALGKALYHLDGFEEARTVFQGVIAEHELVMEAYDWLATQRAGGRRARNAETRSGAFAVRDRPPARPWRAGLAYRRSGDGRGRDRRNRAAGALFVLA